MTVRDLFFKVMRERGLTDDQAKHCIETLQLMRSVPLEKELEDEQLERAEALLNENYEVALADPAMAKAHLIAICAKEAAKN